MILSLHVNGKGRGFSSSALVLGSSFQDYLNELAGLDWNWFKKKSTVLWFYFCTTLLFQRWSEGGTGV